MGRLQNFLSDVTDDKLTFDQIVQKHILAARSEKLDDEQERDLRIAVSDSFNIPVTSVCIVGSAKLGFRLFPKPKVGKDIPERAQFSEFDDHSDIDVAIISQGKFLSHWRTVYNFFRVGGYAPRSSWKPQTENHDFSYNLTRGWIRPDAMPGTGAYDQKSKWQSQVDLINQKRIIPYAVKVGLYFDDQFLMGYHANGIQKCKEIYAKR